MFAFLDLKPVNLLSGAVDDPKNWKRYIDGGGIRFVRVDITPDMAEEMLENTLESAKNDYKAQALYAEAMRSGGWIYNGMAIVFSRSGKLIDGYQRLKSCVETGEAIDALVAFNLSEDTVHSMDQQRSRTFANILEARGHEDGTAISSALSKLIRIENGDLKLSGGPIGMHRLETVFDSNPEIQDAMSLANINEDLPFSTTARVVFFFMAIKAGHGAELRQFLRDMMDDDNAGSAGRTLFGNISAMRRATKTSRLDVDMEIALLIMAFNEHLDGRRTTHAYYWEPDYGKGVKLRRNGRPGSMAQARKKAPANCGLPALRGFPGTTSARMDSQDGNRHGFFHGATADELRRARGTEVDEGVYLLTLTPEMADYILRNFNKVNRKIQKGHVERIAEDIRKGRWMVNPQPICFTGNPFIETSTQDVSLINGQHRLSACVKSKIPMDVVIATGIPAAAFATYDQHVRRSKIAVKGDARVLESAAVFQWRKELGYSITGSEARPTNMEISEIISQFPEMSEHFRTARQKDKISGHSLVQLSTAGVMTFFLTHVHHDDPLLAPQFVEDLKTGAGLAPDNPVVKGRSYLASSNRVGERISRKQSLEYLMDLWERYKKWSRKKEKEAQMKFALSESS